MISAVLPNRQRRVKESAEAVVRLLKIIHADNIIHVDNKATGHGAASGDRLVIRVGKWMQWS